MKPLTSHRAHKAALGFPALVILCTGAVQAASSTWSGATDGDFLTGTNWSAGVPGAASGTTNADIATFNNNVQTAVALTAGRNLKGITFDGNLSDVGAFTLTGSTLTFSAAGTIAVTGMNDNSNQTINNNLSVVGGANANDLLISTSPGYTGTLNFGGNITSAAASGTSQITLAGGSGSNMNFTGDITNGTTALTTFQLGTANRSTVTLSGNNTFGGIGTAGVVVRGGRLIADYSGGKIPLSTASRLNIGNGILEIKGASSGSTTATVDSLDTLASSGSTVVVNNPGSGTTTLALGANQITRGASSALLFDLSSSGSAITYGVANNTLGLLKTNSQASTFFVKDATGIGFATVVGGLIVRNTTYAGALPTTGGNGLSNYSLTTAGILTATGSISLGTVDVNTTAGAITIDMGTNVLRQPTGTNGAFSLLVTGSNDFALNATVAGGFGATTTAMQLAHYGTGTVTIGARSIGTGVTRTGPGLVVFTNTGTQSAGGYGLVEGVTRFTTPESLGSGVLNLSGGAIFELGGDLNGATAGDFSRALGSGTGAISMSGHVGFSARDADRVVNFGGSSGLLTWGNTNTFTGTLTLGSTVSTHTLEIQNPIALGSLDRNVHAENGSAAVDGKLSGVISGTGVGIQKTGAGTLELTAANTYSGNTTITGGTLKLANASTLLSSPVITVGDLGSTGTVLDLTAKTAFTIGSSQALRGIGTVNIGTGKTLTIEGSHSAGGALNTVGTQTITGNLAYASGSIFSWDINASSTGTGFDKAAVSGDLTADASSIFRVMFGTTAKTNVLNPLDTFWNTPYASQAWSMTTLFGKDFTSGAFGSVQTYDSVGSFDVSSKGSFTITGSTLTWTAVPEPTSALAGILLSAGLLRRRRV